MSKLYELSFLDTGVYLKILTMQGKVLKGNILNGLQRKKVSGIDFGIVDELIENPNTEEMIAPPQQEMLIDETITITIDKEKMNAFILFYPPDGGRMLNIAEIVETLKDFQVVSGIHVETLKSLAGNTEKAYERNINIATGTEPIAGIDAVMSIRFPVVRNKAPAILENGSVDYKDFNRPNLVSKNDILAVLVPHTLGTNGMNVLGEELKAVPGKPRIIPNGKGTELLNDDLELIAMFDGYVEIIDGRITVLREYNVKGDVGPATGHIDFPGDVNIEGNVIQGYNVTAAGTINVGGCIEASIITAGSNIVIRQGVKGISSLHKKTTKTSSTTIPKCVITSRGNITSKFIENATVTATGVVMADSIVSSIVASNDSVVVRGKIGNIQGGKISALNSISCTSVGAGSGVSVLNTSLNVGTTHEMRTSYIELRKTISDLQTKLAKNTEIYSELPEEDMTPRQTQRRENLKTSIEEIQTELFPLLRDMKIIRDSMKVANAGEISVAKTLHPTVHVTIGNLMKVIEEDQTHFALHSRDGAIVTDAYPNEE